MPRSDNSLVWTSDTSLTVVTISWLEFSWKPEVSLVNKKRKKDQCQSCVCSENNTTFQKLIRVYFLNAI